MKLSLVTALFLAAGTAAYAAPVTYSLTQTAGANSATGTVTTDGATGVLAESDITAFHFVVSNGIVSNAFSYVSTSSSATNGAVYFQGSDLTASATALLFNFAGVDGGGVAFADATASNLLCFVVGNNQCVAGVGGNVVVGLNLNYLGAPIASANQVIGTLTPAAVTPEPSSLLLLGTGALGAFATLRRRIVSR